MTPHDQRSPVARPSVFKLDKVRPALNSRTMGPRHHARDAAASQVRNVGGGEGTASTIESNGAGSNAGAVLREAIAGIVSPAIGMIAIERCRHA